jgi:hypothetical protein
MIYTFMLLHEKGGKHKESPTGAQANLNFLFRCSNSSAFELSSRGASHVPQGRLSRFGMFFSQK